MEEEKGRSWQQKGGRDEVALFGMEYLQTAEVPAVHITFLVITSWSSLFIPLFIADQQHIQINSRFVTVLLLLLLSFFF